MIFFPAHCCCLSPPTVAGPQSGPPPLPLCVYRFLADYQLAVTFKSLATPPDSLQATASTERRPEPRVYCFLLMGEGINQANTRDFLNSNNSLSKSETFINHQESHFYTSNFFFSSLKHILVRKRFPCACHLEQVTAEGKWFPWQGVQKVGIRVVISRIANKSHGFSRC